MQRASGQGKQLAPWADRGDGNFGDPAKVSYPKKYCSTCWLASECPASHQCPCRRSCPTRAVQSWHAHSPRVGMGRLASPVMGDRL